MVATEAEDRDTVENLRGFLLFLADSEFRDYSPIYDRIARAFATDDELLAVYAGAAPRTKMIPILLFGCAHYLVLGAPDSELAEIYRSGQGDPWPLFRQLLTDRRAEVVELLNTRAIQTNEVGRAALTVPALAAVQEQVQRPLALVELGPSAGLNLFLDRFHCRYGDGAAIGPADSPVQLRCEVLGSLTPPRPTRPLPITSRQGIDINPLDITDDDQRRWLEACIWPGLTERQERFRAAAELARAEPPLLHRGNAVDLLADVLAGIDDDAVPCLLSTWVLAYFAPEERQAVYDILDDVGRARDLAIVTGEYGHIVPWVPVPERQPLRADTGGGSSLLGLTRWIDGTVDPRAVAWTHSHGYWLEWLDEESGTT